MKYVKYMPAQMIVSNSRNRREILSAVENGFMVTVFSSDTNVPNNILPDNVEFIYDGKHMLTYDIPKWRRIIWVIFNNVFLFVKTCKLKGDIWSCHDIGALKMAWFVTRFRVNKPKLIYDSHEFEIERNIKRSKISRWRIKHWERFLMKRCTFSIMVNDNIADEVQKIHNLKERPIVVRSTPNKWKINDEVCKNIRKKIIEEFGKKCDSVREPFILMYHGGVIPGRGVETLIEVLSVNPKVLVVILGNGEEWYLNKLKKLARDVKVDNRVLFHPAVELNELWKYVGAVDVGTILVPAVCKSYYYALPNKFFENIQSLTPIICSNYPAMRELVERYGIGLTCNPKDLNEINECIERMRLDKELYNKTKNNLLKAKEDLCWENEKKVFEEAYKKYLL